MWGELITEHYDGRGGFGRECAGVAGAEGFEHGFQDFGREVGAGRDARGVELCFERGELGGGIRGGSRRPGRGSEERGGGVGIGVVVGCGA